MPRGGAPTSQGASELRGGGASERHRHRLAIRTADMPERVSQYPRQTVRDRFVNSEARTMGLFRQFSLRVFGKRFLKRFGSTLKRRFLRQEVHRRFARFEQLEDRSLMTVIVSPSFRRLPWASLITLLSSCTVSPDPAVHSCEHSGQMNRFRSS